MGSEPYPEGGVEFPVLVKLRAEHRAYGHSPTLDDWRRSVAAGLERLRASGGSEGLVRQAELVQSALASIGRLLALFDASDAPLPVHGGQTGAPGGYFLAGGATRGLGAGQRG